MPQAQRWVSQQKGPVCGFSCHHGNPVQPSLAQRHFLVLTLAVPAPEPPLLPMTLGPATSPLWEGGCPGFRTEQCTPRNPLVLDKPFISRACLGTWQAAPPGRLPGVAQGPSPGFSGYLPVVCQALAEVPTHCVSCPSVNRWFWGCFLATIINITEDTLGPALLGPPCPSGPGPLQAGANWGYLLPLRDRGGCAWAHALTLETLRAGGCCCGHGFCPRPLSTLQVMVGSAGLEPAVSLLCDPGGVPTSPSLHVLMCQTGGVRRIRVRGRTPRVGSAR